jgi:hypothetical protein
VPSFRVIAFIFVGCRCSITLLPDFLGMVPNHLFSVKVV